MFKQFLKSSKEYKVRLRELRIQALTLCVYNLLIAHFVMHQEELVWNFGLVGTAYREKIGIQTTFPVITSKFGFTYGFLNLVFAIVMSFPVFKISRNLRSYLLPGIIWNVYFVVSHASNIISICYDIIVLVPGYQTAFWIITAAAFIIIIHIMLLLDTISYYDLLNMKTKQLEDATLQEIEDCFEFSQNPWLLIENEYLMRNINIYKKDAFVPMTPPSTGEEGEAENTGNDTTCDYQASGDSDR